MLLLSELDWGMARTRPAPHRARAGGAARHVVRLRRRVPRARSRRRARTRRARGPDQRGRLPRQRDPRARRAAAAAAGAPRSARRLVRRRARRSPRRRRAARCSRSCASAVARRPSRRCTSTATARPENRAAEMRALLDAIDAYDRDAPVVIGGDLNAFSLGLAELVDSERVAAALRADPRRWSHPVPHEPLFAIAAERGFEWSSCNALGVATLRHATDSGSTRGAMKLDWFLCRGIAASAPRVIDALGPANGSDALRSRGDRDRAARLIAARAAHAFAVSIAVRDLARSAHAARAARSAGVARELNLQRSVAPAAVRPSRVTEPPQAPSDIDPRSKPEVPGRSGVRRLVGPSALRGSCRVGVGCGAGAPYGVAARLRLATRETGSGAAKVRCASCALAARRWLATRGGAAAGGVPGPISANTWRVAS